MKSVMLFLFRKEYRRFDKKKMARDFSGAGEWNLGVMEIGLWISSMSKMHSGFFHGRLLILHCIDIR